MKRPALNITFHNPNAEEETAKYLTNLIEENIADKIIQAQNTNLKSENTDKRHLA